MKTVDTLLVCGVSENNTITTKKTANIANERPCLEAEEATEGLKENEITLTCLKESRKEKATTEGQTDDNLKKNRCKNVWTEKRSEKLYNFLKL